MRVCVRARARASILCVCSDAEDSSSDDLARRPSRGGSDRGCNGVSRAASYSVLLPARPALVSEKSEQLSVRWEGADVHDVRRGDVRRGDSSNSHGKDSQGSGEGGWGANFNKVLARWTKGVRKNA